MATLITMPMQINARATEAEMKDADVVMTVKEARLVAECWHKDQEKIAYLESLLLRK